MKKTVDKNVQAEKYRKLFENHLKNGILIKDATNLSDSDHYELMPDDDFRQCYDPNNEYRKWLPEHWFCNQKGVVLAVSKKGVKRIGAYNKAGYASTTIIRKDIPGNKTKRIMFHNLVRRVFKGVTYGPVDETISEYGLDAFGKGGLDDHHFDQNTANNSYENGETCPRKEHIFLHKKPAKTQEDKLKKLNEAADLADKYEPGKISIFIANRDQNGLPPKLAFSAALTTDYVKKIGIRPEALHEIEMFKQKQSTAVRAETACGYLCAKYGKDFFNKERALCINNELIWVEPEKGGLSVNLVKELSDTIHLADQIIYTFVFDENGNYVAGESNCGS